MGRRDVDELRCTLNETISTSWFLCVVVFKVIHGCEVKRRPVPFLDLGEFCICSLN